MKLVLIVFSLAPGVVPKMDAPPRNSLAGAGPGTPLALNLGGVGPASPTPGGVAKSQLDSPLGQDCGSILLFGVAEVPFLMFVSSFHNLRENKMNKQNNFQLKAAFKNNTGCINDNFSQINVM